MSGDLFIADSGNSRIRKVTPQGIISSVAGNGTPGFSGDGGPATSAQLDGPMGVAADASGNLFIADRFNGRIRKVTPQGIISTVAGNATQGLGGVGGAGTSAQLSVPVGVAVDASGNLFIADSGSSLIRKVTPQGTISTVAGNGGSGFFSGDGGPATSAQLSGPVGVAVDASGNLFIVDGRAPRVLKVTSQGTITSIAGNPGFPGSGDGDGGPATLVQLSGSTGVAVDASGNLFIGSGGTIRELVPSSTSTVGCVYSIDQSGQSFGPAGGNNSVGVLASGTSCPWLAISHADWIIVTPSGVAGGTGLVTYTVSPNAASASRVGTIWIAGQSLTVNQSGVVCSLSVSPRSIAVPPTGVTGRSLSVGANAPDCQWTAAASVPWILLSGGTKGTGTGTVTYTVGVNTGGLRTGTITIAGRTVYINQAGAGGSSTRFWLIYGASGNWA